MKDLLPYQNEGLTSLSEWRIYFLIRMKDLLPYQNERLTSLSEWRIYFLIRMKVLLPYQNEGLTSLSEWRTYFLIRMKDLLPYQNEGLTSLSQTCLQTFGKQWIWVREDLFYHTANFFVLVYAFTISLYDLIVLVFLRINNTRSYLHQAKWPMINWHLPI